MKGSSAKSLRIGIVAPPWFEVPPPGYGGIEWMCYWLVEGLLSHGHDVSLVAAGADKTGARFLRTYSSPPRLRLGEALPEVLHAAVAMRALGDIELDVVHDHSVAGPLTAGLRRAPTVVTAHGSVAGEPGYYYRQLSGAISLVALSEAQRASAPDLPWVATVYNGIPVEEYPFHVDKDDFIVFLGRMSPEKGAHLAVEAAREAGVPLKIAGKCIEPKEHAYFASEVAPRIGDDVEWLGEAKTDEKKELLAKARCLIFPIRWGEPFGIVMLEAMACGTPVVALRAGSVPEVVEDGVTGFVCTNASDLPEAVKRLDLIAPNACRDHVARHFDTSSMVAGYEAVYSRLVWGTT